jgi:hypothetical protein
MQKSAKHDSGYRPKNPAGIRKSDRIVNESGKAVGLYPIPYITGQQKTSKLFQLPCQLKNFVGLNAAPFFWFQEEQKVLFNMFTGH